MKKIRIMSILALVLFTITSLSSCDKAKGLEGTTWEGDFDFMFVTDDGDGRYQFDGTITLDFTADEADVIAKFKMRDMDDGYTENLTFKGRAKYTYESDKITLKVNWKNEEAYVYGDEGKWTGTVDKTTMTLKNVFGETVKFKK